MLYLYKSVAILLNFKQKQKKYGFKYQQLLVWDKGNAVANRYYMNSTEYILMLRKGNAKDINNRGTKNILRIPNILGNKNHPTEKPISLMEILITNSSSKDDVVLDPFIGTGATGLACIESCRKFVGIEIDRKYYDIAVKRIKEIK